MASTPDFALADDKEYHAMFSFHSEDRVWVRKTLETLEAEPYGLKCCFADRDFHPGQDVLHNIETCMRKSMNIIIVVSPEHMDSVYCDYEIGMAIEIAHRHEGRVIPVLRRGYNVPSSVRIINYIDAQDGVDEREVIHKLVKAITQGLDTMTTTYTLVESSQSKGKNGEEVLQTSVRNKHKHCISMLSTLPPLAEDQLRECRSLGIQALSQKDKLSGLISQCTCNRNLLVCIGNQRNEAVVRFVAYDVTECQVRVKEKLFMLASQTQTVDAIQVAEITEAIIKRAIPSYIKVLIYSSHIAPRRRHMNKGDLVCLCQYIEQEKIHLKVFREFIQPVLSWHDITRLCLDKCCQRNVSREEQLLLNDSHPNGDIEV